MSYSDFTLNDIKKRCNVKLVNGFDQFINNVKPLKISARLADLLCYNIPLALAIDTEKARSELIVMPVLVELKRLSNERISLFSGIEFNVDSATGLNGRCDFIVSLDNQQLMLTAPIITVVEAKNDDINSGLGQCIAEMLAAKLFNEKEQNNYKNIFGIITTGSIWKFLLLVNDTVYIQSSELYIEQSDKIWGVLMQIIDNQIIDVNSFK